MALTVGYGRVSTGSGEQLSALKVQLSWLKRQACDLILSDVDSGLNTERCDYQQLKAMVEKGQVAIVIATALARLGRDAIECDLFVRFCDQAGVVIKTRDDGVLTLKTPDEMVITRLKGSMAQAESMRLSTRVKGGIAAGRILGKPMRKPCWGYRLSDDRMNLEPHPQHFVLAQRFIKLLRQNEWRMLPSLQQFDQPIPLSSVRAVRSWLLNPTLRGGIGYQQLKNHSHREVIWDRHPALLSHELFAEFELVSAANRRRWGHNATVKPRLLTGLCVCAECGWRLKYVGGRTVPSLKCSGNQCSQLYKSTREALIASAIIAALAERGAERLAALAAQGEPPEAADLRRQISGLSALGDPDLEPVIIAKQQRLELVLNRPGADPGLSERLSDLHWYDSLEYDELRRLFQRLVEKVVITKQAVSAVDLRL